MIFFYYETPKIFLFWWGGGVSGVGAVINDFFLL